MIAQAKKDKLISELVEARRSILSAASSLSPEQQDAVFLGVWSVKDLLAHLTGWDYANIEAVQEILDCKLPSFYAHHDGDWKTFNAGLVAQHERDNFADLLSLVQDSHHKLIDLLSTVPAEEFGKDRGLHFRGYRVTIASTLQAEAHDERVHRDQVARFAAGRSTQETGTEPQ